MYMDLQEVAGIPSSQNEKLKKRRSLSKEYEEMLCRLINETKTVARPTKLTFKNSPLHTRFKKPYNLSVYSQIGDTSPPPED